MTAPVSPQIDAAELREIERVAVELACIAGEHMQRALEAGFAVEYKTEGHHGAEPTDPVSEVDRAVEAAIRDRLAADFPTHHVVGEEVVEPPAVANEVLWAIDPVDGTSNFVNGFPLFSASIGVMSDGVPIAGAIWCSSTHQLRHGVYHARAGSQLYLDGELVTRKVGADVRRRLAAAPGGSPGRTRSWDNRITGSAAIECAFTAAGIFNSARFHGLRIWDLAAGVVLVRAAGGLVLERQGTHWEPFERFVEPPPGRDGVAKTIRDWSTPLILGEHEVVEQLATPAKPGLLERARQLVFPGHGR